MLFDMHKAIIPQITKTINMIATVPLAEFDSSSEFLSGMILEKQAA